MVSLVVTILIDTSVVKVNDLIDRYFIPLQSKLILFSINSIACILLQYFIIRYIRNSLQGKRSSKTLKIKSFHLISIVSLGILGTSIGLLIFQQFYFGYYESWTSTLIIIVSYGTGAALISWLAILFLSWYRSNRRLIVFLYFVSMIVIAFNLVMAATYATLKANSRPAQVVEYVGGSGDIAGVRYKSIDTTYSISSFMAFFSIWLTTAILLNYYREKVISRILYWVLLSIPIVYFAITFFYQLFLSTLLISYLEIDPIAVSIFLSAFLSLSRPIGGLLFGAAFWNISRTVKYERRIRTYMIISGWGIFLIFTSNQAETQVVGPYPPFGLATITVLNLAAYLVLLGIYNSAKLVSVNNTLRKNIYQHALRSGLLHSIGQAEMEKEIQKTVNEIIKDQQDILAREKVTTAEFDEKELRKYLDQVINEVKKDRSS
jgi:hypothetical protein